MPKASHEWRVIILPKAIKDIRKLPRDRANQAGVAIDHLAEEPHPQGSMKLAGRDNIYRLRLGDYRLTYLVSNNDRTVTILRVRHRSEIYRDF